MLNYQQENPYASPEGAAEAAVPEVHGIWRDGDELVLVPLGVKAPKACWVTNKTGFVVRFRVPRCSLLHSTLLYSALAFAAFGIIAGTPLLGGLGFLVLGLNVFLGERVYGWLSWGMATRHIAGMLVEGLLILSSVFVNLGALSHPHSEPAYLALPLVACTISAMTYLNRILLGLHAVPGADVTIRIRGVHPDYLARLPDHPDSVGPSE
jgi:hypothetical protein